MLRRALFPCLMTGCSGPVSTPDDVLNHDLAAELPAFGVVCERGTNALRGVCTVDLPEAGPVEVRLTAPSGEVRRFRSDTVAEHHEIDLYLLPPNTVFETVVVALGRPSGATVTGIFETLPVPPGADVSFVVSEGTPGPDKLGFVSPCVGGAYAVIVDPHTNTVLWYEDLGSSPYTWLDALSFTEDHTLLGIVQDDIVEVDLLGRRLLRISGAKNKVGFHHDVFRKDGLTYVLFKETVLFGAGNYLLDGFLVFDAQGAPTNEWHLADHFTPEPRQEDWFPVDYSHANSIWVDDDAQVLISFRHLSAIALVDGDPSSPGSGEIVWRLSKEGSAFGSDFLLTSLVGPPADFERQHNAHFDADGSLMLFDNRSGIESWSRALVLNLAPLSGKAQITQQFVLPRRCDYQGSALRTSTGNVLATCAPLREAWEFDAVTGLERWYGSASCRTGFGSFVPRFVPLDW